LVEEAGEEVLVWRVRMGEGLVGDRVRVRMRVREGRKGCLEGGCGEMGAFGRGVETVGMLLMLMLMGEVGRLRLIESVSAVAKSSVIGRWDPVGAFHERRQKPGYAARTPRRLVEAPPIKIEVQSLTMVEM
jgi:hypothetical protein